MASLKNAKRLVVKIGSALLVNKETGALRGDWLHGLAQDVAWLRSNGTQVVLVSSGSMALGRGVLNLPKTELSLEQSQAAAAVGQIRLARAYEEVLTPHRITTAQILMTLEDTHDRRRYLNLRSTFSQLLDLNVVPILNENDTIATDEIRFGDNDRLAAQIAATIEADQLVLLSDVDGFYSANPSVDPTARRYDVINEVTPEIEAMAGDACSGLSKGGMKTKVLAAKTAMAGGCSMAICEGSAFRPLKALEDGAPSTWFTATLDPQTARKRWVDAMKPCGMITLDEGASHALANGNSLLPAGVTEISGDFERGDPVALIDNNGHRICMGLTRYASDEAQIIKGHQSHEIEALLGYSGRAALVHRDDMAL
jgi:glutamate 5-kinase